MKKKYTLIATTLLFVSLTLNVNAIRGMMGLLSTPAVTRAEISGKDGVLTVSAANTIVNKYARLMANAPAGSPTITIENQGGPNGLDPATLTAGDLILIIQMAGALIDSSDSPSFGTITNLNNAGRYEFVTVSAVSGNVLTINPPCGGLRFSYTAAGKVQVIRVPQYTTATINAGASLTAPAWNGVTGGIVAIDVETTATIDGAIDVSGLGFRGGALSNAGGGGLRSDYRSTQQDFGSEKGEGIAGYQMDYDAFGGRYGRGAAANAGGGGTAHNSGGGGGANGANGKTWNGQGIMDGAATGAMAWQLDPGYIANGNALTDSSGGGRGGYSYAVVNGNALTQGPGNEVWQADRRREVGGLGGRPVPQDPSGRIFLGGGGGAGAQNDDCGGAGGAGGGLIYIRATAVSGAGQLKSNGASGGNTRNAHRDAPGGAGAGGTIVVTAQTLGGISAQANGGNGGNQTQPVAPFEPESEGPGGGGGGGFIAFSGGSIATEVKGGSNGLTGASSLSEFPVNGATRGAAGATTSVITAIPFCSTTSDLTITKTNNTNTIVPGAPITYTIAARNNGLKDVFGVEVKDTLPAVFANISWTCSATGGSSCHAANGSGHVDTRVNLLSGGIATFQVTATPLPSATGTVTNTATIAAPPGAVDINPGNNSATDTDTLTPQSDLGITKTNGTTTVTPGTNTTYTIVVTNNGPSTVPNATVSDPLPAKLGNATWTCTASQGSACGASNGQGGIATTVSLIPGGRATFILSASVLPDATGTLANVVTVAPPGTVADLTPSNNTATDTDTLAAQANLSITKTASPNPVRASENVTYTIVVTNSGPSAADAVSVTDPLAPGLTLVSASSTKGVCSGTQTIVCGIGKLDSTAPNNSATITIVAKVSSAYAPGPLSNTATVSTSTSDSSPGNNSSTATVTVTQVPSAKFPPSGIGVRTTAVDVCFGGGNVVTYEVKLTNSGTGVQRDNPGAEFTAALPTQLTAITGSCTASNGVCTAGANQIEWNGSIQPGATVTITYQVRIRQGTPAGVRFCTDLKVNYDTDNDGVNDATTTVPTCLTTNCAPAPCTGPDCPSIGPGLPMPELPNTAGSDQRPGSILIFPFYISDPANANSQNTRISITNIDVSRPAYLHMFFIDGSTCSVADNFLCLTPNQTTSFLISDLDPGVSGYLIAVAVDSNGCPTKFNYLIGDEYVKLSSGHQANLGAEAIAGIDVPACSSTAGSATIQFDGLQYNLLGRVVAADSLPALADGNSTLLVLNRIGGELSGSAATLGPIFGVLYNDAENAFSFNLNPSTCQLRAPLTGSFPRTSPRFPDAVPAGRTGWMKLWLSTPGNEGGLVGATINANTDPNGYRGGHNLHKLTLGSASLTIPVFPPSCQ